MTHFISQTTTSQRGRSCRRASIMESLLKMQSFPETCMGQGKKIYLFSLDFNCCFGGKKKKKERNTLRENSGSGKA